jgi:hypothetical protein
MWLIFKSTGYCQCDFASGERVRHGRLTFSPEESNIFSLNQIILMRYNIELSRPADPNKPTPFRGHPAALPTGGSGVGFNDLLGLSLGTCPVCPRIATF